MASTDTSDERAILIRRLLDATEGQDISLDVFAEDLYWSMPKGRGRLMGERHGRAAVGEAFAHVLQVSSEHHTHTEAWEILADELDTISFNHDCGVRRSDGAAYDFEVAIRWEIVDGQVAAMHEYIQDEELKGDFF